MLDTVAPILSWKSTLVVVGLAVAFQIARHRVVEERKIKRLGSRAPRVRSQLPLGMYLIENGCLSSLLSSINILKKALIL